MAIKVIDRLESNASDGVLAITGQIYDNTQKKPQSAVNTDHEKRIKELEGKEGIVSIKIGTGLRNIGGENTPDIEVHAEDSDFTFVGDEGDKKLSLKIKKEGGLKKSNNGLEIPIGSGLRFFAEKLYVNPGDGLDLDDEGTVTVKKLYLDILKQLTKMEGNGAGLKYTDKGLLTIDTGDGLEVKDGKLVATGNALDDTYKDFLDRKLAEELDSKFGVAISASPSIIERGVSGGTNVTLTATATNTTGKAIEYIRISTGDSDIIKGTTTPLQGVNNAIEDFTASAEMKLVGHATKKTASTTVKAYYAIYSGASAKEELTEADVKALTKKLAATAVGKYPITIPSGGAYFYLAVPKGNSAGNPTSPTKILGWEDGPDGEAVIKTLTVGGVKYEIWRTVKEQDEGATVVQFK